MGEKLLKITFLALLSLSSCKDEDLVQGKNSLNGSWQVTAIESIYGNGSNDSDFVSEEGNLGQFIFGNDSVYFEFTRNDTLYQGADRWHLHKTKVRDGFVKVPVFTLEIENNFSLTCEFDDGTRNSEKNATEITLLNEPEETGVGTWFMLFLDKD